MDAAHVPAPSASQSSGGSLLSAGFLGLLATQFLTATNDNIFRWLVIGIGKQHVDPSRHGEILTAGTVCLVLPYLVLAAPAGYLADKYPKRTVIVGCKLAEIVIMVVGVTAILCGRLAGGWAVGLMMMTVALLGAQAALFSPARAGSIPEILKPELISKANGLFTLFTVIATVNGMIIGNWLVDATGDKGLDRWWLSAIVLIGVAVARRSHKPADQSSCRPAIQTAISLGRAAANLARPAAPGQQPAAVSRGAGNRLFLCRRRAGPAQHRSARRRRRRRTTRRPKARCCWR